MTDSPAHSRTTAHASHQLLAQLRVLYTELVRCERAHQHAGRDPEVAAAVVGHFVALTAQLSTLCLAAGPDTTTTTPSSSSSFCSSSSSSSSSPTYQYWEVLQDVRFVKDGGSADSSDQPRGGGQAGEVGSNRTTAADTHTEGWQQQQQQQQVGAADGHNSQTDVAVLRLALNRLRHVLYTALLSWHLLPSDVAWAAVYSLKVATGYVVTGLAQELID
jgi:hypothetical protein